MAIDNFGIAFANKVARRTWQEGVFPAITNRDHEGQVKAFGDRLRILMFLSAGGELQDYSAGSDMSLESIYDDESTLVIEKRKYWNFPIDRLEEVFSYVSDVADSLVEVKQRRLAEELDTYVLAFAGDAKVGSHVGFDMRVVGSSRDTEASIATTSTGGTLTVQSPTTNGESTTELGDGTSAYSGFTSADIGKGVRLLSGTSWATPWYKITAVTNSTTASIVNWDEATAGSEIPNGDILRGLAGDTVFTGGAFNVADGGKPTTQGGWGWEIQAAYATTITAGTVYEQVTELDRRLNENEIPDDDRHIVGPPSFMMTLKQASEVIPSVQMAYDGVVINGKVGRIGGFTLHSAAGMRVSTRTTHATASGQGGDIVVTAGNLAFQIPAWHRSFCTFAYKWAESRTVEAENQFARKYQGLHLYGAVVPLVRRRAGAILFGAL